MGEMKGENCGKDGPPKSALERIRHFYGEYKCFKNWKVTFISVKVFHHSWTSLTTIPCTSCRCNSSFDSPSYVAVVALTESAQMGQWPSRADKRCAFKILSLLVSERLRVGHPYVISIWRVGRGATPCPTVHLILCTYFNSRMAGPITMKFYVVKIWTLRFGIKHSSTGYMPI